MDVNLLINYFLKILVFLILILIQVNCKKIEDPCDISLKSNSGSIKWKLDPSEEQCDFIRWRVTLEKQGGVDINVTKVFLSCPNCYLLLGPGLEPDLFLHDVNVPIVISSQKVLRFVILERNQFSILLQTSKIDGSKGEFELSYDSYYNPAPLTSSTTTPKPPPATANESAVLYINNTSPREIWENRFELTIDLATIANMYINANNNTINISRELTYDDVYMWDLNPCHPGWPNWARCAAVNVSIEGLQSKQIILAWRTFGNEVMNDAVYKIPEDLNYIWLWVGISAAVILLIMIIVCACHQTRLLYCLQIKPDLNRQGASLISSRSSDASSWFPTLTRGREYSEDRRSFSNGHQWISADLQVPTEENLDGPQPISQENKNFSLLSSNTIGAGALFYSINDPVYDFPDEDEKDA